MREYEPIREAIPERSDEHSSKASEKHRSQSEGGKLTKSKKTSPPPNKKLNIT